MRWNVAALAVGDVPLSFWTMKDTSAVHHERRAFSVLLDEMLRRGEESGQSTPFGFIFCGRTRSNEAGHCVAVRCLFLRPEVWIGRLWV